MWSEAAETPSKLHFPCSLSVQAFIRIRDVRQVELVNRTEAGRKVGASPGPSPVSLLIS